MENSVALEVGTPRNLEWSRYDTTWMPSLFGTAVGAGIMFLPINAGI